MIAIGATASRQADRDSVLPQLKRSGWTMLIGDSVLQQEFFALAKVFVPDCSPMAVDLNIERIAPAAFFQVSAPPEYAMICKKSAKSGESRCRMLHQPCLALTVPQPCPDPATLPFCGHNKHPTCDDFTWRRLADEVTAEDVEFALTFHWAPGPGLSRQDPDIGALRGDTSSSAKGLLSARLAYKQPGAIVMNNCLHSWPYSWGLPTDRWRERLSLFLKALQLNLQELSASAFQGSFGFQACMPLACTEHFAWRYDWGLDQCPAQNSELMAVNTAVRRLFSAMHLRASFVSTWDIGLLGPRNYLDGVHPCFTRPCSWAGADGKPVPGGTAISNPPQPKYNGLMDLPSTVCLNAAERMWGRLKSSKWPRSNRWFNVTIPDISDLWAAKFINAVPPVSPALLRALAPKPVIIKPYQAVAVGTGAPTVGTQAPVVGTQAPMVGTTGAAVAGTTGASVAGGTGAPVLAAGGTPRPSLPVGTLPPAYAVAAPAERTIPMWMWALVCFLALVCSSQIWGQVDGQKKLSTKHISHTKSTFGLLSVVEFEPDEVELAN